MPILRLIAVSILLAGASAPAAYAKKMDGIIESGNFENQNKDLRQKELQAKELQAKELQKRKQMMAKKAEQAECNKQMKVANNATKCFPPVGTKLRQAQ